MVLSIGILTVSTRVAAGEMKDRGGPAVAATLAQSGWTIARDGVVPDDFDEILRVLQRWADDDRLDVIVTTGGTGLGPHDVTPEATQAAAPRLVPGIVEAIRAAGLQETTLAMLSRGVAALRGTTLIINLPGNPEGAAQGAEVIRPVLEHATAIARGGHH